MHFYRSNAIDLFKHYSTIYSKKGRNIYNYEPILYKENVFIEIGVMHIFTHVYPEAEL